MVFNVILPKWDNVTDNVIYPLNWPFQSNSQHCFEILTAQPNYDFSLDQNLHTKSTLTRCNHCTWPNPARMRRFGYRVCKTWFQVIMPHKSLKFLSPHYVVHWSLKAKIMLTCCLVHKMSEFEVSMWAVYPQWPNKSIQFRDTPIM